MSVAVFKPFLTSPSGTCKAVRGAVAGRANGGGRRVTLSVRPACRRRAHFVPRAGPGEPVIDPKDAPGEGKRVRPGVVDKDPCSEEGECLEPWKGPQMTSKGVAPDEVEPLSDAFKKVAKAKKKTNKEFSVADAPGEGKRRIPAVAEHADTGGKPKPVVQPRNDPVSADE